MNNIIRAFIILLLPTLALGQILTESNLPIIVIETSEDISNDERISGTMKIYYKEDGATNKITDEPEEYNGFIGIKYRGQSSLTLFTKKGYSIETRDEEGEDENVSLLDMPKENDWVLHGPYSDKSLMRNALLYTLADSISPYAPRVKMVEIVVNDDYQGVYLFTEKIKRDGDRVDVSKLKDDDIEGDDLTGGYILKIDEADDSEVAWVSPYSTSSDQPIKFSLVYPEIEDIAPQQIEYIEGWMTDFEDLLDGDDFDNEESGYRKSINTESFIDLLLLNELSRNVDAYRLSTYMFKDKDSDDDELHIGPVWDYNLAFGNADFCDGSDIEGWAYDFNSVCPDDTYQVPFWWSKLLSDPTFADDVREKWMKLRNGKFKTENIMGLVSLFEDQLSDPQQRNFQRWDVLGTYVWPNSFVGSTYEDEIEYLRTWILDRLEWMDQAFDIDLNTNDNLADLLSIHTNPVSHSLQIDGVNKNFDSASIFNLDGQVVMEETDLSTNRIDVSNLSAGQYWITVKSDQKTQTLKFVKM